MPITQPVGWLSTETYFPFLLLIYFSTNIYVNIFYEYKIVKKEKG